MTATDVRAVLIAAGVTGSGTASGSAWVCLVGGLSDRIDAPQVAIIDTTGLPPMDHHGSTPATGITRPGIQVLIRGNAGDYAGAEAKAAAAWTALHRASTTNLLIIEGTSNPAWLGLDDKDRPRWSINFTALRKGGP